MPCLLCMAKETYIYQLQKAAGLLHTASKFSITTSCTEKYKTVPSAQKTGTTQCSPLAVEPEGAFATAHCKGSNCFAVNGTGREWTSFRVFASVHLASAIVQAVLAQPHFMPCNVHFQVCV